MRITIELFNRRVLAIEVEPPGLAKAARRVLDLLQDLPPAEGNTEPCLPCWSWARREEVLSALASLRYQAG